MPQEIMASPSELTERDKLHREVNTLRDSLEGQLERVNDQLLQSVAQHRELERLRDDLKTFINALDYERAPSEAVDPLPF